MSLDGLYDVIIIGGGASGLFAAGILGGRQKKTLLLEHNNSLGKKILISGGGRCNFTNRVVAHEDFYSENKHFSKSALGRYQPEQIISFAKENFIEYYEKKLGQLFCKNKSQDFLTALTTSISKEYVEIKLNVKTTKVLKLENIFCIETNCGEFRARNVIIATGGLALPSIGASNLGYKIAKSFSLTVTDTRPALVPFLLKNPIPLAGISFPVEISILKKTIYDDLLFTHKGLSGPVTLKASLYWEEGVPIYLNFCRDIDFDSYLKKQKKMNGKKTCFQVLKEYFPQNFLDLWLSRYLKNPTYNLGDHKNEDLEILSAKLNHFRIVPKGDEGYRKAEVTRGGVATSELSSKTMEAKKVQGLYFIGEVVDVTGQLGGYNFQWAWSSAYAAASTL